MDKNNMQFKQKISTASHQKTATFTSSISMSSTQSTSQRKQSNSNINSSSIATSRRTVSTGSGVLAKSTSLQQKAVPNINSSVSSAFQKYQPVYDHTRNRDSFTSFPRQTPSTNSLRVTAAEKLFTYGVDQKRKNSLPLVNSVGTTATTSSTWNTAPTPSCSAGQKLILKDSQSSGISNASTAHVSSAVSGVPRYDLKNMGYVLIIHNTFKGNEKLYRKGSEHDMILINKFFKSYRVKVAKVCEDYSVQQVKNKMTKIRSKNFRSYSCLIIIIMSHGDSNESIHAKDKMYNFESEIVDPILMNDSLKDKPKLFFVQACKGNAIMETDFHPTATNKFDMLKCYSTYEGTVSLRNIEKGSFFMQTLFPLIEENEDKEICVIMTLMRNQFSNQRIKQAPTETSTLTKHFHFSDLKKK